jgi:Lhr-like helicase
MGWRVGVFVFIYNWVNMKTYTIRFNETYIREIEVKANSEEEAEQEFIDNGYTSNDITFESSCNTWEIESITDNNILVYEHNGKEKVFKYEKDN